MQVCARVRDSLSLKEPAYLRLHVKMLLGANIDRALHDHLNSGFRLESRIDAKPYLRTLQRSIQIPRFDGKRVQRFKERSRSDGLLDGQNKWQWLIVNFNQPRSVLRTS